MRILALVLCAWIASGFATPAIATECANAGAAPGVAPDDTGDGGATACGSSAVAAGDNSTALGYSASSAGDFSTAIGYEASSGNDAQGSTAIGALAASQGQNSTALGYAADSGGNWSTALGFFASSDGNNSTALGRDTSSAGEYSTALGYAASSAGASSTALGPAALSLGVESTALGFSSSSTGVSSTALGYDTHAGGDFSIALGYAASSAGASSTALGDDTTAAGDYSTALGYQASAVGNFSSALGYLAVAEGINSVALGLGASSTGASSIALGRAASSAGVDSTALGRAASSAGDRSIAVGFRALADQPDTVILGAIAGVNGATAYANVGIGTSAPTQAVDVERSGAAARFQLTSFTAVAEEAPQYIQRRARGTRTAPTAVLNNDNLGLFSFRGYNGSVMGGSRATITAQAAGNFTGASTPTRLIFATTPVGQTTPQQVLVITPDGKVQVNGQNLTVPDYVFEDDYPLMPLEELRAFIDENGHLPGIPSADEVNAKGHDLAGSDMVHLRKIEELTLYTLQQQERIEQLEAQLADRNPEAELAAVRKELREMRALLTTLSPQVTSR